MGIDVDATMGKGKLIDEILAKWRKLYSTNILIIQRNVPL
jgi:hypothetical protein